MNMQEIRLTTKTAACRVIIGTSLPHIKELLGDVAVYVVDKAVVPLLSTYTHNATVIPIPKGEASKELRVVEYLYEQFLQHGLDRTQIVCGVGGGAALDVAGFAASTYLRGVRYATIPTTLLAQVDASIGGKNGVNFAGTKNLIGAIQQPELSLCDLRFLGTLPISELRNGFAEVVKSAAIADASFVTFLEDFARLLNGDLAQSVQQPALEEIVFRAVRVKTQIVEADERETDLRRLLNFGHTFGHALEIAYDLPHGEAVARGMVIAANLSVRLGLLEQAAALRLTDLIAAFGLPTTGPCDAKRVFPLLVRDKKRVGDTINMVLLRSLGKAEVVPVRIADLERALP